MIIVIIIISDHHDHHDRHDHHDDHRQVEHNWRSIEFKNILGEVKLNVTLGGV